MKALRMVFAAGLVALMLVAAVYADADKAPHFTNMDEALAAANDKEQNVLIDFYTDWCKYCKMIDTLVLTDAKAIAYFTDDMVLTQINAEVDTALATQYHISGYPTLVLVKASGEEIDRIVGYLPTEEFLQTLRDYQNGIGTLDDLLSQAKTAEDRELYFEIANKYKYRGGPDDAVVWFKKVVATGEPTDSLSGEARISLADMKRRAKEYDAALDAFKAVESDFSSGMFAEAAVIWQAIVYRAKGDTATAVTEFERFVATYPESEDVEYAQSQIKKLTAPPETEEEEGI